jgi:hypothetical protein
MQGIVMRLCWSVAWLAAGGGLPIRLFIYNLAHQPQHAAHNVSHNHLAWLRRSQSPANLPYALNQLCRISSLELTHYAQEQGRSRDGTWSRVANLSSLEQSGLGQP